MYQYGRPQILNIEAIEGLDGLPDIYKVRTPIQSMQSEKLG